MTLFVIFISTYLLRLQVTQKNEVKANKNYLIQGKISSIKKISDKSSLVKIGSIKAFLTDTAKFPHFKRGDLFLLNGRLEKRVINHFYQELWLINPEIKEILPLESTRISLGSIYFHFLNQIDFFRVRLEKIFLRTLPVREASLLSGIVLGSQGSLPPSFYEALRKSGTLHIVVASGMNVTILGKVVLDIFLKRFKRNLAIFVSLFCILIYTFLAGGEPPIVRAAIMGSVAFSAQVFGRQYWAGWALFLALGLMLLISPSLLFQASFQLSASATAGLVFLSSFVKELIGMVKAKITGLGRLVSLIESDITETVSAQIAVMPLLLVHFGQFNFLSVLPNVLVAALIPILMRLGGLLLAVGLIFQPLANAAAWVVWVPLKYMVLVVEFFGNLSWLTIELSWPWWLVLVYWGGLAFLLKEKKIKTDE